MDHEDEIFSEAIEKKVVDIAEFIQKLPDERKHEATWRIVWEAINWGSWNYFDAIGMLEDIKLDFRETSKQIEQEDEDKEEDSSDKEEGEDPLC
jgi:hypothetical protein